MTVHESVRTYLELGWAPIPIPARSKSPLLTGWPELRVLPDAVPKYFPEGYGVGVVLGAASGITDVDLDCVEAVALASKILPLTARFGRHTKPDSHFIYSVTGLASKKFLDPEKAKENTLLEIRADRCQTVFPPSIHPSGEEIFWSDDHELTPIDPTALGAICGALASACVLVRYWPNWSRTHHDIALALGGCLAVEGWDEQSIVDFVETVCVVAGDHEIKDRVTAARGAVKKIAEGRTIRSWGEFDLLTSKKIGSALRDWLGKKSWETLRNAEPEPERVETHRPTVLYSAGFESSAIDAVVACLPSNLFQRSGQLVQITRDLSPNVESIITPPDTPQIVEVTHHRLGEIVDTVCSVVTPTKSGRREISVPPKLVQQLLARREWRTVRKVTGIAEWPIVRPDGSVAVVEGYDSSTGLWVYPTLIEPATAEQGLETLADLVDQFPFDGLGDFAVWLGCLLSVLGRHLIPGPVPLTLIDKNLRGAGGSKLAESISLILTGRSLSRLSESNGEEDRKRMLAMARSGQPLILMDNISEDFGSSALDAALTSCMIQDRLLGVSDMVTVPFRAVLIATGNNVRFHAEHDTIRRVAYCRLLSPDAEPEKRTDFKYPNLEEHIKENRAKYLGAAIGILSEHMKQGARFRGLPWGSFEGYSQIVRGSLERLGLDVTETRDKLVIGDADAQHFASWLHVFRALEATRRETSLSLREVVAKCAPGFGAEKGRTELWDFLGDVDPKRDTKTLGARLRKYKDRRAPDGSILRLHTDRTGLGRWHVEQP